MIKNNILVALRNFKKQKGYTALNFIGLSIGLAVTLVITLYTIDDLTFDGFHENGDRIHRILSIGVKRGTKNSITAGPLVVDAMENIPEIKYATRIARGGNFQIGPAGTDLRQPGDVAIIEARTIFADSQFFKVFGFKLIEGASGEALAQAENIYLTPAIAEAIFGEESPVGKAIAVRGLESAKVAGIVAAPPPNSHLQFEMIVPLIPERNPQWWNSWESLALVGYVLLEENADPAVTVAKMVERAAKSDFPEIFESRLQPLKDIHLGSTDHYYDNLNEGRSDRVVFFTMTFVGILVLLVACINFVNLTTSRASQRAQEVGLRKVVGSSKGQLITQFLGESVLMTILTFFAAVGTVMLTLPYLNIIMNKHLKLSITQDFSLILLLFFSAVVIGLASGIYPALIISSFRPVNVLKGEFKTGRKGVFLRRALVVFQFTITTILLISILIVISQVKYLQSIDIGYNRSHVVAVPNPLRGGEDLLKRQLESLPVVVSTGRMDALPGPNFWRFEIIREGRDRTENPTASRFSVDEHLLGTLEISLSAGRNFSHDFPSDADQSIIVNETLVRKFEYENPVGTTLRYYDENNNNSITSRTIIGVIKDFHYITARQKPEPMIFLLNPDGAFYLMVRIAPGQIGEALPLIEAEFKKLYPDLPFRYDFLDESFNRQFSQDRDFMRNITLFTGLAIFIACLGLIGLVAFSIDQRRKEIAIRKILGCREKKIFSLLISDFTKWVLLANLAAWPAAFFITKQWLNDFVFRLPFRPGIYLLASVSALAIALLTISFQTLRAIHTDPSIALREIG